MATTRNAARQGKPPSGFATIRHILDGNISEGALVNIVGIVTDFRAPIPTRGKDWKCQMKIYDQSVEDEPDHSILLNIFWPETDMPDARCGDVIIAFALRVQYYLASYSLCTHKTTDIHIYESGKIPKPRLDASKARRPSTRSRIGRQPSKIENEFVSTLHGTVNKERIPSENEFEVMKINSTNIKRKFSELKDVRDGMFADTVVQIVREPYDLGDKMTLWVSDYTEHSSFYPHKLTGGGSSEDQAGDAYGYQNKLLGSQQTSEWTGPFGQLSLQVTCFEPHASIIRDQRLKAGTWISMRNLQIKFGHNSNNLEGYLREDRGAQGIKINISYLDHLDKDTISHELKNALRRKQKHESERKEQLKSLTEAAIAGKKRKAELGLDAETSGKGRKNAKKKRTEKRASKQEEYKRKTGQWVDASQDKDETASESPDGLNEQVKCENINKPATSIADLLQPIFHETIVDGDTIKLQLPFINANYRTYARVTNFLPSRLEEFARPKKRSSEYAALSDYEDSDSDAASDSENDDAEEMANLTKVVTEWEWHFCLQLEDASPREGPKKSIWVTVNNKSAQMLLNLDASDLEKDDKNLGDLRQRLFYLWGDLEEYKCVAEKRALAVRTSNNAVPPDSDDEEQPKKKQELQVSNRPFGCCLCQYGAKVTADDDAIADAGDGKRWERMYGLFGTRISGV